MRTRTATTLATIALAAATACSSAAPTKPTPPTSPPAPSSTASASGSTAIRDWYAAGGQTNMHTLTVDLRAMQAAVHTDDVPALRTACATLTTDIRGVLLYGKPMPDTATDRELQAGLNDLKQAGIECSVAIAFNDVAGMKQVETDMLSGAGHIAAVNARIDAVT